MSRIRVSYVYDAIGTKLTKNSTVNGVISRQDYVGGIEYSAPNVIERIVTEEGYLLNSNGTYSFHYYLTDHLGKNRVVLKKGTSLTIIEIIQRQDYFAFGKTRSLVTGGNNRYLYNGQEVQKELGDQLDYGAKFEACPECQRRNAEIGRFTGVDPIAEKFSHVTVYNYAENSPIANIDLWGLQAENFMSKFKKLNNLQIKVPDMSKAQIQVYQTMISDPKVSVDELKNLFLTSLQKVLSNSKATFHAPVDGNGDKAKFEKGNFIKIDIVGPFNNGYVKIHDVKSDENSAKATFVTMEGHMEKGVIIFKVKGKRTVKYHLLQLADHNWTWEWRLKIIQEKNKRNHGMRFSTI